nr:putative reverse transcriptase domain-containing protein [Tanacetum cinerariifolium]
MSTAYHPETDGQSERTIQTLEDMLQACRGKLNPRYIGPFKILKRIGPVVYKLELPEDISNVYITFHVSNLKKCLSGESLIIPIKELQLDDKLNFVEEPVEIMDREVKKLKQSRIPIFKVRWNSKRGPEFTWECEDQIRAKYKDLLRACPHHGFIEFHQLNTFYNALNPVDQDSLNAAAGGNLLERRTQVVLTVMENKSKVRNSRNKAVVFQVKSCDANSNSSSEIAKLTDAVNQQTSACLAAGDNTFPELRDNIQGYVSAAAVNYNQGNSVYRPP